MPDAPTETADSGKRAPRDRSPSFPFIPLEAAVDRLEKFEDYFKRHPAPADKAGLAWGMKEKSSQAYQTLAALKAFGLIQYKRSGTSRQAELTDDGRTYLRAQQDSIKDGVLKRVALKPAQIAKFFDSWGADRPPDPVCIDDLVLKHSYTESAAQTFLRVYDETIAYAGLNVSDKISNEKLELGESDDEGRNDSISPEVKEGDLIQWTSRGVDQFRTPAKVLGLSDDGQWVFSDQGPTGIPLSEVTIVEAHTPENALNPPPPPPHVLAAMKRAQEDNAADHPPAKGYRKATFPLDEGDVTIQFPEGLSVDGYDELEGYLEVFMRNAKKQAEKGDK